MSWAAAPARSQTYDDRLDAWSVASSIVLRSTRSGSWFGPWSEPAQSID
jgi:hypothetical protein